MKGLALSERGGGGELAPEPALGEEAASEQMGSLAQMGKDMGCKTVWLVPRPSAVKGCMGLCSCDLNICLHWLKQPVEVPRKSPGAWGPDASSTSV